MSEVVGIYWGDVFGDDTGIIRFYISPRGALNGNIRVSACANPIQIVGIVDASGGVTWRGTGCGVTYRGRGTVEELAPGSPVWVGQGTWRASNGTTGTWGVRRRARIDRTESVREILADEARPEGGVRFTIEPIELAESEVAVTPPPDETAAADEGETPDETDGDTTRTRGLEAQQ